MAVSTTLIPSDPVIMKTVCDLEDQITQEDKDESDRLFRELLDRFGQTTKGTTVILIVSGVVAIAAWVLAWVIG